MKKFILLLILLIITPILVKADNTSFNIYNAKVINKNGISYEGWENNKSVKKTIPYNTNITISILTYDWINENTNKNEHTTYIGSYYQNNSVDINLKDVTLDKDNFTCDFCKNETVYLNNIFYEKQDNKTVKILNPNGLIIKNGPADDFSNTDKVIPFNTEVKLNYILGLGDIDDIYYWANVYYKGTTGFIKMYNNDSVYVSTNDIFMTIDKTNITFNDKTVGTIEENTIIGPNYKSLDYSKFYINYNDVSGFIDSNKLAYSSNSFDNFIIKYDHSLLNTANKKSKVLTTIPAGTEISYRFRYYKESEKNSDYLNCVYTKYNKFNGWVCLDKGEEPEYIYNNSNPNTTKTTTKVIKTNELVNDNSVDLILITTIIVFVGIIVSIVTRNIILKKKKQKYLEEISKIEEDKD